MESGARKASGGLFLRARGGFAGSGEFRPRISIRAPRLRRLRRAMQVGMDCSNRLDGTRPYLDSIERAIPAHRDRSCWSGGGLRASSTFAPTGEPRWGRAHASHPDGGRAHPIPRLGQPADPRKLRTAHLARVHAARSGKRHVERAPAARRAGGTTRPNGRGGHFSRFEDRPRVGGWVIRHTTANASPLATKRLHAPRQTGWREPARATPRELCVLFPRLALRHRRQAAPVLGPEAFCARVAPTSNWRRALRGPGGGVSRVS